MRKAGYPAFLFIAKFRIVFRKLDDNYTYNNAAYNIVVGVLNMGSLRRLLLEGMKMPSDLPDSAYVIIDDIGNDRYFEVIIEDPDTPIYDAFGADTLASLQVSKAPSGYCDGAWQIIGANAKDGYGPLAYDIAMEYVGNEGLMCDRTSVSEDAAEVWNFYLNSRPDVKAIQLDSFKKPFLTPKDASDDCTGEYTLSRHTDIDIDSGFDPYGNEAHRNNWINHWSTKKYVKISGTPIIDELNDLNVLYYDWEDIGMRITESKFRRIIRKTIFESVGHSKMDELIQRFLDDPRGLMIAVDDRTPYNGYSIELIDPNEPRGTRSHSIGRVEIAYFPKRPANKPCYGAYEIVGYSRMRPDDNLGPLLYDIGIELAGKRGLMSDRSSVSAAAQEVWEKYLLMRNDVKRKQLDSHTYNWTDDPEDDCGLYTSSKRYSSSDSYGGTDEDAYRKWVQGEKTSPLSKVYYKEGTPVMDRLKNRITMNDASLTDVILRDF